MKKKLLLIGLAALAGTSATLAIANAQAAQDKQLVILNWPDYTSPEMIAKFEAETGIKVTIRTDNSEKELLQTLIDGTKSPDVVVVQNDSMPWFLERGLISDVNVAGMSNFSNVEQRWKSRPWDPEARYSAPWMWGVTGYSVDTKVYDGPADSLKTLFQPPDELKGKIGMFGGASDISLALVYLGKPLCTSDAETLKAVGDLLKAQKPFVKLYDHDVEASITNQVSGKTAMHEQYSGRALQARLKKPSIKFVYPKEGVYGWMDNVVVAKAAPHPEAAKAFLNFIMAPENIGLQQKYTGYQSAIKGSNAIVGAEISEAPEFNPPADVKIAFAETCSPEIASAYEKLAAEIAE